jgi:PKD domain
MNIFRTIHLFFAITLGASFLISSCKKNEEELPPPIITEIIADTTHDKTLPRDTIYFSVVTNIPATIEWDFGDGSSNANGENVMHVFSQIKYYRVSVTATANDRTAIGTTDVNTTIWKRCSLLGVKVKSIPATNPLGGTWDSDATGPDLFVYPDVAGFTNTQTPIAPDIPNFTNLNVQLNFNFPVPQFTDLGADFKIALEDDDGGDTESVAAFILSGGLKELLNTNTTTPPTTKTLISGASTIEIQISWLP